MLWVEKIGYYQLVQPKVKADDWIIIMDESIGIGQEKILLILGIRKSEVDFSRPLKLNDLTPRLVKSKPSWNSQMIHAELDNLKTQLGTIIYCVADGCSTLKKSLCLSNIDRVYDITHSMANFLEKIYKKDKKFISLMHESGQMRFRKICIKHAHLIPPNQRSKARFLNIDIVSILAIKAIDAIKNNRVTEDERNELEWVLRNCDEIT